jgi:hypothetical protein
MTTTRHHDDCTRVFARYDATCPRCAELAQGAPARRGWGGERRAGEAARLRAIRAHTPATCPGRDTCCTCFDW